ncbi:MAG: hypothetical protein EA423_03955 [Phycisphaerales bacterium]|nr:MAG: hypothetical protein EA423_03955 [Phycisphaerales bacterium]
MNADFDASTLHEHPVATPRTLVRTPVLLLVVALLLGGCAASGVPDARQSLGPEERRAFDELVLRMLDREALYTVAGGLKPMSSGFWSHRLSTEEPDLEPLARTRALLELIEDGEIAAGVMVFAAEWDSKRSAEAFVVHRASMRRMLNEQRAFWAPLGIDPGTDPEVVIAIAERLPRLDRFRAYGYLFGYPDDAIDFFVAAAAEQEETGSLVRRRFISVPTHEAETNRFVWAVPEDYAGDPREDEIREIAGPILDAYREKRERYGERTPAALFRAVRRAWPRRPGRRVGRRRVPAGAGEPVTRGDSGRGMPLVFQLSR